MKIIPAIDLIEGKCVRLSQGDYTKVKVYREDPLDAAMEFFDNGITHIHLVDLDGARAGQIKNIKVLERLASRLKIDFDFGGGVQSKTDVNDILNAGAKWVTIGSLAVRRADVMQDWINDFGGHSFMLGADVRGEILQLKGWTEASEKNVFDFIKEYTSLGVFSIFCTDISKDGMMQGPSLNLYKRILDECSSIQLIASGGVTVHSDLMALKELGCSAAIVGKALYEGTIQWKDLKGIMQ
jgi:phosphoribosylformimino-5-aminoimidazole carboxamide ribotide isomerase